MTKKELYACDICHTDYRNEKDALLCEKAILNAPKSQTLDTTHFLNFHAKSRWSFPMEQSIGTDSKELRWRK